MGELVKSSDEAQPFQSTNTNYLTKLAKVNCAVAKLDAGLSFL